MSSDNTMRPLCPLQEIPSPGSRGFSDEEDAIFVVRVGDRVFGYRNRCPHTGSPLDWVPDLFLSADSAYIQCSTHLALFRIDDGRCIAGPCTSDCLEPVPVRVVHGEVVLDAPSPQSSRKSG